MDNYRRFLEQNDKPTGCLVSENLFWERITGTNIYPSPTAKIDKGRIAEIHECLLNYWSYRYRHRATWTPQGYVFIPPRLEVLAADKIKQYLYAAIITKIEINKEVLAKRCSEENSRIRQIQDFRFYHGLQQLMTLSPRRVLENVVHEGLEKLMDQQLGLIKTYYTKRPDRTWGQSVERFCLVYLDFLCSISAYLVLYLCLVFVFIVIAYSTD